MTTYTRPEDMTNGMLAQSVELVAADWPDGSPVHSDLMEAARRLRAMEPIHTSVRLPTFNEAVLVWIGDAWTLAIWDPDNMGGQGWWMPMLPSPPCSTGDGGEVGT